MAIERIGIPVPDVFDQNNKQHLDEVLKKVADHGKGTGWEVASFDPVGRQLTLQRQTAVTQVTKRAGEDSYRVEIPRDTRPTDGDKIAAKLEGDPRHAGYFMTRFDPYAGEATLSKLSKEELRCRNAVAVALGVKPWDVGVTTTAGGGFNLTLPHSYVPSKHDDKLQEVAEAIVGKVGWYFTSEPAELTAEIVPSKPPMLPEVIPFQRDLIVPSESPAILAPLPIGLALAERGDQPSEPVMLNLEDGPHTQVGGTSGGGKALHVATAIPTPTGWTTMGQLELGSTILGRDGKPCTVTWPGPVEERELYCLVLDDGQSFLADGEHQWIVTGGQHPAPVEQDAAAVMLAQTRHPLDRRTLAGLCELYRDLGARAWPTPGLLAAYLSIAGVSDISGDLEVDSVSRVLLSRVQFELGERPRLQPGERVMTTSMMLADGGEFQVRLAAPILTDGDSIQRGEVPGRSAALASLTKGAQLGNGALELETSQANADTVRELARGLGFHVTETELDDELVAVVISSRDHLKIVSIAPAGTGPARCIQVDSADASYLVGEYVPTHNTVTLNGLITGALLAGAELAVIDLPSKAVDFQWVQPFVRDGGWGCESMEEGAVVLERLYAEGAERAATLKRYGAKKLSELPLDMQQQMRPILVVADEVTGLFAKDTVPKSLGADDPLVLEALSKNLASDLIQQYIQKIAAEYRFVGFKLVLSTQVAGTQTGIGTALRTNLQNKFLLGAKATDGNRKLILRDVTSVPVPPAHIQNNAKVARGVGVAELEGQPGMVFKSSYADTDDLIKYLRDAGVPERSQYELDSTRPDPKFVQKRFPDLGNISVETAAFEPAKRTPEAWEVDPNTGEPYTDPRQRANAARHYATVNAKKQAS